MSERRWNRPRMSSAASRIVIIVCGCLLLGPGAAAAQDLGFRSWGLRIGVTVDPDQIHFGAHVDGGHFAPRVRFQPSFEFGLGDDRRVGAFNIDALYEFDPRPWRPYLGGGLGVALVDFDEDFPRRRDDDLEVGAGLNVLAGIEWGPGHRYLLEVRAGLGDLPDLKVTAGIDF